MRVLIAIMICASVSACGASASPTIEQTKNGVEAHAQCIDRAVKKLNAESDTLEEQMQFVRRECAGARKNALSLDAVPIFEDTVPQYDSMQADLARALIASKYGELTR